MCALDTAYIFKYFKAQIGISRLAVSVGGFLVVRSYTTLMRCFLSSGAGQVIHETSSGEAPSWSYAADWNTAWDTRRSLSSFVGFEVLQG